MKIHSLIDPKPGDAPAYVANGLIGLRVGPVPFPQTQTLLNGYVARQKFSGSEGYDFVPYPVGCDIQINGTWLSRRPDLATFERQDYDFSCGELASRFAFTVNGVTAVLEVLTFCSRSIPTLVLQEVKVTLDSPAEVCLRTQIDHAGVPGRCLERVFPKKYADALVHWEAPGALSTCGSAFVTEFLGADAAVSVNNWGFEEDIQVKNQTFDAEPGRLYTLHQYGSLVPSAMHAEPHWQALRLLGVATWQGFDKLRVDNRAAWSELWRGRIVILGADSGMQDALDAAFFYQKSSVHPSSPCSVAPFGLGSREAYYGHVFWDAETFVYPIELLTQPEAARAMLDYRSRMLPAAAMNARMNGYLGVQFPWQSYASGGEVTPVWAGGGITEHHVNADVAVAFAQYVHATDDDLFARQSSWPVIQGVAEWIMSRVTRTGRGYEILHVTGPIEEYDNVNNDAYTNMSAALALREASALGRKLGMRPPVTWDTVADGMVIPLDAAGQVIVSREEGAPREPGVDALAAFFPLSFEWDEDIVRRTMERVVASAKPGGAMFSGFMGVYAARLGDRRKARELLETGLRCFVSEPFSMFTEVADPDLTCGYKGQAPFLSNPAGSQISFLFGLTGLCLGPGSPASWAKLPVVMPEGWDGIEVERIWAHGGPAHLRAVHGAERARIELI